MTRAACFLLILIFLLLSPFVLLFGEEGDGGIGILSWNLESGGSDSSTLTEEIIGLYQDLDPEILVFSEVEAAASRGMLRVLTETLGFQSIISELRGNDRLAVLFNPGVFELVKTMEMKEIALVSMRPALAVTLLHRERGAEIIFTAVHLARNPDYTRYSQSRALRIWATRKRSTPLFLLGDFNYDIDIDSLLEDGMEGMERDRGFDILTEGDRLRWLKPINPSATQYTDSDGDEKNDYNAILDCVFVNPPAFRYLPICRVVLRAGDFPDTDLTSDHRPLFTEFFLDKPNKYSIQGN